MIVAQLPRAITPTVAGLAVGAFVGVFGFVAVLLVVGRGQRRPAPRRAPELASFPRPAYPPPVTYLPGAQVRLSTRPVSLPFRPSTALSARALAKVYGGEESAAYAALPAEDALAHLVPPVVLHMPWSEDDAEQGEEELAPESIPVSVTPILVVDSAEPSEPHPFGIIKKGSPAMSGASFEDFDIDEGATEIAETVFDEPPQPRRRTDPPKIRAVAPSGPRFAAALPTPTPPPARVSRHHS